MWTGLTEKLALWAAWGLSALALLALSFFVGTMYGGQKSDTKHAKEENLKLIAAHKEVDRLNGLLEQKEKDHGKAIESLRLSYAAASSQQSAKDAAVVAALRSGERRLRFQVAACGPAAPASAASAASGAASKATAELDPAFGARIFGITHDGDDAIRQLTVLQDYTLRLWADCNGKPSP